MNLMDMTGRNVLITGAAQGIGFEAAKLLYAQGARLTLLDANPEKLATAAETFDPQRVLVQAGSVTDRAFLQALVEQAGTRFGGVHGLVNNAGIIRTAMIDRMTVEQWQQVIDVNLTGVFNCLQIVGGDMKRRAEAGEQSPGTIGQINYGAAKSGVLGITMSAAREWGRYGIRVNSVAYGVVATDMTEVVRSDKFREKYLANIPLGRFLEPDEAVKSIVFLVSEASSFITGQHLSVNGGSHITA